MRKLVFNDSRQIEVQSVEASDGVFHARIILTTPEALKAVFQDTFATSKMGYFENEKEVAVYENFTAFKYIKEEVGGIFEIELRQTEADTDTVVRGLAEKLENTNRQITELQMAMCDLFETMEV